MVLCARINERSRAPEDIKLSTTDYEIVGSLCHLTHVSNWCYSQLSTEKHPSHHEYYVCIPVLPALGSVDQEFHPPTSLDVGCVFFEPLGLPRGRLGTGCRSSSSLTRPPAGVCPCLRSRVAMLSSRCEAMSAFCKDYLGLFCSPYAPGVPNLLRSRDAMPSS